MNVFDLVAKITLSTTEYDKALSSAGNSFKSFGDKISSFGKGLQNSVDKIVKAEALAFGAATAAAGAFIKSSIDAGSAFDTSMAQVAATMGKTVDEIQDLREFAQRMGATTAFSATQAADALNYMALAGYSSEKSMQMLPNVLNLAAAGAMDLADASDMVTDAQSALGLNMNETTALVDKMATTSSKSNTSVSQLGNAILQIGATARSIKGGTTELVSVLGVLADNGIKGAEGGTALRNIIMSLQTPTKEGIAALKRLGMTYDDMYDSAGNMRAIPEILLEMQGKMEGMTQASKDAIVSGIFNKFDIRAVNALLGTSSKRFEELTSVINESAGAAEKMAGTQLNNLEGDVTLFKSALEGVQIALSDKIMPYLREFVQFGTEGLTKVTEALKEDGLSGAFDTLFEVISEGLPEFVEKIRPAVEKAFKVVGDTLISLLPEDMQQNIMSFVNAASEAIGKLIEAWNSLSDEQKSAVMEGLVYLALLAPAISGVGKAIETIGGLISGLGSIISFVSAAVNGVVSFFSSSVAPIVSVIGGLVLAVTSFVSMWQNGWDVIKTILEALGIALVAVGAVVLGVTTGPIAAAIAGVVFAVSQAAILIHDNWDAIAEGMEKTWNEFTQSCQKLWDDMCAAFQMIGDGLSKWWNDTCNKLQQWWNDFCAKAKNLWDSLQQGINDGVSAIRQWWSDLCAKIKELWESAKQKLNDGITAVKDNFSAAIDNIKRFFTDLWNAAKETADSIRNKFSDITQKISGFFSDIINNAFDWGKDLIDNFVSGIESMWESLVDTVSEMASTVSDYLGFSEPKKGPLSNFHTYAPDMVELFAKGITDNIGVAESAVERLAKSLEMSGGNGNTNSSGGDVLPSNQTSGGAGNGFTFNQTINAPTELDPSEVARQARNSMREMVLQFRMA